MHVSSNPIASLVKKTIIQLTFRYKSKKMREEVDTNCIAIKKRESGCHLWAIVWELGKALVTKNIDNNTTNCADRGEEIFSDKNDKYVGSCFGK